MPDENIRVGDSLEEILGKAVKKEEPPHRDPLEYINDFTPIHKIPISGIAMEKMFILAEEAFEITKNRVEVYSLSVGTDHTIQDILIPAQNVTSASVFVEEKAILEIIPVIRSQNLTILGWNHSHGDFGVFFSGTDYNNQKIILADTANYRKWKGMSVKYTYGMTVNLRREVYGIVSTQIPTGKIFDNEARIEVIDPLPENWDNSQLKAEIIEDLEKKIKLRNYGN